MAVPDTMQPFEMQNALRSHTVEELQDIHRRLRYFSFVVPRPKEGEGDSLQVWWKVTADQVDQVLAGVNAAGIGKPELQYADAPNVLVHLWNDAGDVYEVDEALVQRAEQYEAAFDEAALAGIPRTTGLAFLTPERHPELFTG
jgi:hypothetical protein